jgi:hypothetical protein
LYDIFIKQNKSTWKGKRGEQMRTFLKIASLVSIVGAAVLGIKIFLEERK